LGNGKLEQRYAAIVIASAGQPIWIPLGKAESVDPFVKQYQRLVRDAADQEELAANLEKLYEKLWMPIEQSLSPDVKRVVISLDGQLNFVSFGTLLDSNERFLAEKYTVRYAANGRDLLRDVKPVATAAAIVFANPDFTLRQGETTTKQVGESLNSGEGAKHGYEKADIEDLTFGPLTGTQAECDMLANALASWQCKAVFFTGKDATKGALLARGSFTVHLASGHAWILRA
jgi:CHAT domain-containing protein